MSDETILRDLAIILRRPGAIEALGALVDVQLGLEAAELERPPLVEVAEDGAMIMVIQCARRTQEMRETDLPASRCTWLPEPEIGGHRCRVCRRAEVGSTRARQLDGLREQRE